MTPHDRSLLIGGAAAIFAVVALYLGLAAVIGDDEAAEQATQLVDDLDGSDADSSLDGARSLTDDADGDGLDLSPVGPSTSSTVGAIVGSSATTSSSPSDSPVLDPPGGGEPAPIPPPSSTEVPDEGPSGESASTTAPAAASTTVPTVSSTEPPPTPVPPAVAPTPPAPVPSTPLSTVSSSVPSTAPPSTSPPSTVAPSTAPPSSPPPTVPSTAPPTPPPEPPAGLDPVEREIVRLTNELRADPSGPLARRKPMPSCVSDPFYAISVDGATGHPNPVGTLLVDEAVSREMSRPWAVEMDGRNSLQHRPNGAQLDIYERLGIAIAATGENIAWFSGYPDSEAARIHFEGWRESDTGHYCAMVSGTYTNLGVGHHKGASRSWAVQNFYRER